MPFVTKDHVLLIDSGAFTAWTKGKAVDIEEYIRFAKRTMASYPCEAHVINLDVIPGRFGVPPTKEEKRESAERGWANYERLRAAGLPVIHVFHMGEDFEWLHRLKASSDYIGISPANDASVKARIAWLAKVFSIIKTDVRAHAFGFTALSALTRFPFFSADSSSWNSAQRYGTTAVYRDLKTTHIAKRDCRKLQMRGFDGERCFGDKYLRMDICVRGMLDMERDVTRLWEARGIVW